MFIEESLPTIYLKHKKHRGKPRLMIHFKWNPVLIGVLKKELSCKWSQTNKCWYLDYSFGDLNRLLKALNGIADVDQDCLNVIIREFREYNKDKGLIRAEFRQHLTPEKEDALEKFRRYLIGHRYSQSAISSYTHMVGNFLGFVKDKKIQEIVLEDLHRYNYEVIVKLKYSISYQRQFTGALKMFFEKINSSKIEVEDLMRPKKEESLPTVLSVEQVKKILEVTYNIKHKTILSILYSSGLRVGELLKLKLHDVRFDRMLINVKMAKGKKDRVVKLSKASVYLLGQYLKKYRPVNYLFEGRNKGKYSPTSVRKILSKACQRAGIYERVTPHTLRHSYATHSLELGIDIRYIQALLGHKRPETTMIYTHVSTRKLQDIANPLDEIWKDELIQLRDRRNFLGDKIPYIPKDNEG